MIGRQNIIVLLLVTLAAVPVRAGEQEDRANAAYARLRAKQTAATQPAMITNAELQELESEVTALRAENAKLRDMLAKAAVALQAAQAPAQPQAGAGAAADPKIATAMAQHALADGMTLAQAEKSIGVEFKPAGEENSDGQDYIAVADRHQLPFRYLPGGIVAGGQTVGVQYRVHVKDGVITYWSKSGFSLDSGTAAVGDSRSR